MHPVIGFSVQSESLQAGNNYRTTERQGRSKGEKGGSGRRAADSKIPAGDTESSPIYKNLKNTNTGKTIRAPEGRLSVHSP